MSFMGALLAVRMGIGGASGMHHQAGRPPYHVSPHPFAPSWPAVMPAAGCCARPAVPPAAHQAASQRRVFSSPNFGNDHARHGARLARAGAEQTQGRI